MEREKIQELVRCMVTAISPLKIYLLGSFADGQVTKDSDFDFYIIVGDNRNESMYSLTTIAYASLRGRKNRPVDIIVSKEGHFEERKQWALSVEREVYKKGILLYDAAL